MKKKCLLRILALTVAAVTALAASPLAAAADFRFDEPQNSPTKFSEMEYTRPSFDEFAELGDRAVSLCADSENAPLVLDIYDNLNQVYAVYSGMFAIAQIKCYQDVTDMSWQTEVSETNAVLMNCIEKMRSVAQTILASPCGEYALEYWGEDYASFIANSSELTDEEIALHNKAVELSNEYGEKSVEVYTIDIGGR